ncbi:MAG: hypothetical protein QME79_10345 [Bacillota bacterium]|nr:hypothetical protein [Bacillota bacterium]
MNVKVKLPRNASGSQAAALVFEVLPGTGQGRSEGAVGGSTTFVHQLTSIVKVTANSRANRKAASISGLAVVNGASDQRFRSYGEEALAVICSIANEGNVFVSSQGRLLIRNAAGRRIKDLPLSDGRGVILPGSTVDLVTIIPKGLPEGDYTAEVSVRYGGLRPLQARMPFHVAGRKAAVGEPQVASTVRLLVAPEEVGTQLPQGAFRGFTFSLANLDKSPVQVCGAIKGLESDENGGLIPVDEPSGRWSAASWISLEQHVIRLGPGEKKNLRLTASVPKEATDGTRYAMLVLEATLEQQGESGTVTTISTPIVITTGKNLTRKAELTDTRIAVIEESGLLLVGATLKNQGNTHLAPSGKVVLRRRGVTPALSGGIEYLGEAKFEDVATIPLQETSGWLLPDHARPVAAVYDKPLELGEYQGEIIVDIGDKLPLRATVTFMVAPQGTDMRKSPGSAN